MNLLVNAVTLIFVFALLFTIRQILLTHSQIKVLGTEPRVLGLSMLWLYRCGIMELFFLALTLTLRTIWQADLWIMAGSSFIAGCSLIYFVKKRNRDKKTLPFAIAATLQIGLWSLLIVFVKLCFLHQFTYTWYTLIGWFLFDFVVIYFMNKK